MVNWKKWFLEEDEDEIYKAEEGRRDKQEKPAASTKESDFDIEEFEEESIVDKKEARKYEEIDLDEYSVPEDFDIEFTEEDEYSAPQKHQKERNSSGLLGRIKGLFSSANDKQFSDEDFEEDFEEDEAEDYKTYLERQRREEQLRKEENYTIVEDFDEEYEEVLDNEENIGQVALDILDT